MLVPNLWALSMELFWHLEFQAGSINPGMLRVRMKNS